MQKVKKTYLQICFFSFIIIFNSNKTGIFLEQNKLINNNKRNKANLIFILLFILCLSLKQKSKEKNPERLAFMVARMLDQ